MTDLATLPELRAPQDVVAPAAPGRRRRPRPSSGLVLALLVLLLVLGWALVPALFAPADPTQIVAADRLLAPGPGHVFGTDQLGRDIYTRVVHGSAISLSATALAVLIGLVVGSLVGLLSGFVGGRFDDVVMRLVDVLLAIPGLLLAMAIVTALGFGTLKVALAVGISAVAAFARLIRADVVRVRGSAYVEAARVSGVRWWTTLHRHVLPNSVGPVLVLAALELGSAVLAVSALSFLGYGAPPPAPEWGSLISDGRNFLATAWWLTTMPGLVVIAVVLAANRVSRALDRDGRTR